MNKLIFRCIFSAITIFTGLSCDKNFEKVNTNPNTATEVIPEFLFTKAELSGSSNYDYLTIGGAMQHMANYNIGQAQGDKYVGNTGWQTNFFENFYINEGIEIQKVIEAVSDKPELINELSAARIWRVYVFHRVTDLYGDIPYFEADKGATGKVYSPKYDEQSTIYNDMFKELEESATSFDPSKPTFGNADLIYGGNVDQWKKFAYSLMLRLGMRLTNIDIVLAEKWVKKAIEGGVIINDNDIATVQYISGAQIENRNPLAQGLMNADYNTPQVIDNKLGGKLSKTLIDYLKNTHDPRLNALSVVWVAGSGGFVADTSSNLQKGMQNGVWDHQPTDFGTYSEPNPLTLLKYDSPMFVFTSFESNLLLAEAALRGWYGGSIESSYNMGVRSGMKQWSLYDDGGVISESRIDAYLSENPFNITGSFNEKLEQISTQKWVGLCFIDEFEVFANWRRTGFPKLTPTNYPGNLTGGTIPRHMVIGPGEQSTNTINFNDAMLRQGGSDYNSLTSRVWWDVK